MPVQPSRGGAKRVRRDRVLARQRIGPCACFSSRIGVSDTDSPQELLQSLRGQVKRPTSTRQAVQPLRLRTVPAVHPQPLIGTVAAGLLGAHEKSTRESTSGSGPLLRRVCRRAGRFDRAAFLLEQELQHPADAIASLFDRQLIRPGQHLAKRRFVADFLGSSTTHYRLLSQQSFVSTQFIPNMRTAPALRLTTREPSSECSMSNRAQVRWRIHATDVFTWSRWNYDTP